MDIPKDIKLKKVNGNYEVVIHLRNPITIWFLSILIFVSFFVMIANFWIGSSVIVFCSLLIWYQLTNNDKLILNYKEIRMNGAVYRFDDIKRIYVRYEQTGGSSMTFKGAYVKSYIVLEYLDSVKKNICEDMILDYQKVVARILKQLKAKNTEFIDSVFE